MKQKILAICMVFASMFMNASLAGAGQITASHSIISQLTGPGGDEVTLQLTVTNQDSMTIQNITLESADAMFMPNLNPIVVGNIPSGGSVSIQIPGRSPQYSIAMPWMLSGSGVDMNDAQVPIQIMSVGN